VQIRTRLFKELTPLPRMPKNGEWDTLDANHCFRKTTYKSMMPKIITVACKFRSKSEPLKRRKHFENSQGTYQVSMNIQFGRSANQTHRGPKRVTTLISRPQMVYITPIMWDGHHQFQ